MRHIHRGPPARPDLGIVFPGGRTSDGEVRAYMRGHAAAARSSLSAPRMTILSASSGSGRPGRARVRPNGRCGYRHAIDIAKPQFHVVRDFDRAAGDIDVLGERLANHARLFMNFLDHKVPMLAFLSENRRAGDLGWRAPQALALRIEKRDSLPRDDRNITVIQVVDHVGE